MSRVPPDSSLEPLWVKSKTYMIPFRVISDIARSNHLLRLLVKRDLSGRYRRAYLSYGWSVLEPLLLAVVYSFIFNILVGSSDSNYTIKIIIGVIAWSLFARSLTTSSNSISNSINLFQFARVPKIVFATSGAITNLVLAIISLSSLIPFIYFYDLDIGFSMMGMIFWLFFLCFTGWSIGLMLAPISCSIPDVQNLVNFVVRAGFFFSPIMWTYDMFSSRFGEGIYSYIAHCNPTVIPITKMRDSMLGEASSIPEYGYIICILISLISFIFGTIIFERKSHKAVINV